MVFDRTAGQYARDWALPQFCFPVMRHDARADLPLGERVLPTELDG